MRPILLAAALMTMAMTASAQTIPSVPSLPSAGTPGVAAPVVPSAPSAPTVSTPSVPGTGQALNPIEKAKMEAECKLPANITKPECVKLMLKP